MIKKSKKRNLVFAFLAGILVMFTLLLILNKQPHYSLIDAEEYFSKCEDDSCGNLFSDSADIKTKKLRVYDLRGISCLISNEDPNSAIVCFRENGGIFFRIGKLFESMTIYYNSRNILTMVDADGNGDFDGLSYDGINENGKMVRLVKDSNLDGIVEIIELGEEHSDSNE